MRDPAAVAELEEALELTEDAALQAPIATELADAHIVNGRWDLALEVIEAAEEGLAPSDRSSAAELAALGAFLMAYNPATVDDLDRRRPGLEELTTGETWGACGLAAVLAAVAAHRGDEPATVRRLLERAFEGDRILNERSGATWAGAHLLIALVEIEDYEGALAASQAMSAPTARREGSLNAAMTMLDHDGWIHRAPGTWSRPRPTYARPWSSPPPSNLPPRPLLGPSTALMPSSSGRSSTTSPRGSFMPTWTRDSRPLGSALPSWPRAAAFGWPGAIARGPWPTCGPATRHTRPSAWAPRCPRPGRGWRSLFRRTPATRQLPWSIKSWSLRARAASLARPASPSAPRASWRAATGPSGCCANRWPCSTAPAPVWSTPVPGSPWARHCGGRAFGPKRAAS